MRRHRIGLVLSILGTVLGLSLGQTSAMAVGPERETITFSSTYVDPVLSEACGVEVVTTVDGRVTLLSFPDDFPEAGPGPQSLTSIHVNYIATAGDNRFVFKDVGVDLSRITSDNTAILQFTGQHPFAFTSVLMFDIFTGEVHEPQHTVDTERARQLLAR